jgi:hypothetical protein
MFLSDGRFSAGGIAGTALSSCRSARYKRSDKFAPYSVIKLDVYTQVSKAMMNPVVPYTF